MELMQEADDTQQVYKQFKEAFSSLQPSVAGHTNGRISDEKGKEKDEKCKIKKEGLSRWNW
ncbi:hypothetical protein HOY80DRAFT_1028741 [Tuber brumale]|nr:hypothetical protein HOY80DRAFT_1028741 [Tuber brumale]